MTKFKWEYKALITRIVDGDTYEAEVDLGFKMMFKGRFRLHIVDTPETFRPVNEAERAHGKQATAFVEDLIGGKMVIMRTYKAEQWDRYVADVILLDGRDLGELITEAGMAKLPEYDGKPSRMSKV
jgi:micrococcal nuclease